jgi:hypothetical protein
LDDIELLSSALFTKANSIFESVGFSHPSLKFVSFGTKPKGINSKTI